MRVRRIHTLGAALLTVLGLLSAGCFPIPQIEEKIVELVATHAVSAQFVAEGELNVHHDIVTVALDDSLDLPQLLEDAGINIDDVQDIAFSGASYEVLVPDPVAGRRIENGEVTVLRAGGAVTTLITGFSAPVEVTGYHQTLDLDPAGVAIINQTLDDLLAIAQGTTPSSSAMELTFEVSGQSVPQAQASNFVWELKLHVSIVGQVTMDLISF